MWPAGSVAFLTGTITNLGNVMLRNVTVWSEPPLPSNLTCSIQAISNPNATLEWLATTDATIAAGHQVLCHATYTIGQDGMETTLLGPNGALAVPIALFAVATATQAQLGVNGSDTVVLSIAQEPALNVEINTSQCKVPSSPGVCANA